MQIVWDPKKAESNLKKHGVSFEEAVTVFFTGSSFVEEDNDHSEHRVRIFGFSSKARLLLVIYVHETDDGIAIISARKAESHERKEYEKRIRLF